SGLPVDSAAPDFRLSRQDGGTVRLSAVWGEEGRPSILLFTEPNCGACDALLPDVGKWQHEHSSRVQIVPVSRGDLDANRAKARPHALQGVLLQKDREVEAAYRADATPSA